MRILLSPAKKMNVENDDFTAESMPVFLPKAEILLKRMREMTAEELKKLWKCNDKIAQLNQERIRTMDLYRNLSPAVFTYDGLAYKYLSAGSMTTDELEYIREHLCILSGFYGVLRPFDGVVPYRLEMQAILSADGCRDLYEFWGDTIYKAIVKDDHCIIDLASKEYSRCIREYLSPEDRYIEVVFGELDGEKVIQKGTMAKMARGSMVRFMAEQQIREPEQLKSFALHYHFSEERSTDTEYLFLRSEDRKR